MLCHSIFNAGRLKDLESENAKLKKLLLSKCWANVWVSVHYYQDDSPEYGYIAALAGYELGINIGKIEQTQLRQAILAVQMEDGMNDEYKGYRITAWPERDDTTGLWNGRFRILGSDGAVAYESFAEPVDDENAAHEAASAKARAWVDEQ